MTNQLAIILAAIIVAAVIADQVLNSGAALVFLFQQLLEMITYLKFWR